MSLVEIINEKNGDFYTPIEYHRCDRCGLGLPYMAPREEVGDKDYCGECAFIMGLIDEKTYLSDHLYSFCISGLRAAVHEGKVYVGTGKFPWERKANDRNYDRYSKWRTSVFERDKYTCRKCGKVGGRLNAHHIKPYSKYPELRTDIDNGITLCYECHKLEHRRGKQKNG